MQRFIVKKTEMEVSDLGLIGSLGPVKELLDQYANNGDARKELIYNLLTSNPYELNTEMAAKTTIGNNNKVLNAYLLALGVKYEESSPEKVTDLLDELTGEQLDKVIDFLRSETDFSEEDLEAAILASKK